MNVVWFSLSFVKYRKIPGPLAVLFCFFLNRPEPEILLSFSIHNVTVHMLNGAPLLTNLMSVWKSSDKFRSHSLRTEEIRTFSFIVDDCYALFLTPNAYGDVWMRIFTHYLFFQCVFNYFQCVITLLRTLSVALCTYINICEWRTMKISGFNCDLSRSYLYITIFLHDNYWTLHRKLAYSLHKFGTGF